MSTPNVASTRPSGAIALFCLGIFFFAVNDALGKWLVADYSVGQLMLVRAIGAAFFLAPMLIRHPASLRLPAQLPLHLLRIAVMAGDTFAFYDATRTMPLADVMTFYLAGPMFVTVLAAITLRERIGPWRALAVAVGFVGVVIALRPSGNALSPAAFVALAGSLMFAMAIVITRQLRETHWLTLVAWQFIGGGVIGAVLGASQWVVPPPRDIGLMMVVGLISMVCFLTINQALRVAQASLLAPFQYTSIVWAVFLGWLVWGDLPTPAMWTGIALIVASGTIVWIRERMANQTPSLPAPAA